VRVAARNLVPQKDAKEKATRALVLIDLAGDVDSAQAAHILDFPVGGLGDALAIVGSQQAGLVARVADQNEISARIEHVGREEDDERDFLTPRRRLPGLFADRTLAGARCTLEEN